MYEDEDDIPPVVAGEPHHRVRLVGLDRIRGFAILLMMVDHVAALLLWFLGPNDVLWAVRHYPTRVSMPLFMVVSGVLLAEHSPSPRRRLEVFGAAVVVNVAVVLSSPGIVVPEILVLWSMLMFLAEAIVLWPALAAAGGLLWATTWPLEWDTYQPGTVLSLLAIGVLAARSGVGVDTVGRRLPRVFEGVGRHPLSIYVAHLLVICVVAAVWHAIL